MKTLILECKRGGKPLVYPLERIRSPRAALAMVLDALHRGAHRYEVIKSLQILERHLGIELAIVESPSLRKRKAAAWNDTQNFKH